MIANERIILDPEILSGKPVVRGTRLSVEFVVGLMADGWSETDILSNYPGLARDDITACLAYARDVVSAERVFPTVAGGCVFSPMGMFRPLPWPRSQRQVTILSGCERQRPVPPTQRCSLGRCVRNAFS
jgi:uncharacterized protein (DUF433 family)